MKHNGQNTGLRNRATAAGSFYLFLSLMAFLGFGVSSSTQAEQGQTGVPVFEITPVESTIKFGVQASVPIQGTFQKWDATLTYPSTAVESGVLFIKIHSDSVDTGSGMKDGKLKGKDFFNVKNDPYITFKSTKIIQTGPTTFEVDGDFTIRGVTRQEKLELDVSGKRAQAWAQSTGRWRLTVKNMDEQRDSVHKDCGPRRGDSRSHCKARQRAAVGVQAIAKRFSQVVAILPRRRASIAPRSPTKHQQTARHDPTADHADGDPSPLLSQRYDER